MIATSIIAKMASYPSGVQQTDGLVVKTVEMHTGGKPLRVIVSG